MADVSRDRAESKNTQLINKSWLTILKIHALFLAMCKFIGNQACFPWKTGSYLTDIVILISVLTGLLLPDPKLLHEGRHAVIGQTYTQHIPLRCARFAHQEGLLDTECVHESVGNVQRRLRGVCV